VVLVTLQAVVVPLGDIHSRQKGFKCCQRAGCVSGIENYVGTGVEIRENAGIGAISKSNAQ